MTDHLTDWVVDMAIQYPPIYEALRYIHVWRDPAIFVLAAIAVGCLWVYASSWEDRWM
jgi:hypothetical protein